MEIVRGYKTELDLNHKQRTACFQHAGCARYAYNWGLARKQAAMAARKAAADPQSVKIPTAIDLDKELNARKPTEFPWMYESSKCAPQEALRDLDTAFANSLRNALNIPSLRNAARALARLR